MTGRMIAKMLVVPVVACATVLVIAAPAAARLSVTVPPATEPVSVVDFGSHEVSGAPVVKEVAVRNNGFTTVSVSPPVVGFRVPVQPVLPSVVAPPRPSRSPFSLVSETCSATPLAPEATCSVRISLTPSLSSRPSPGEISDSTRLTISIAGGISRVVTLQARVRHPTRLLRMSSGSRLGFGPLRPGQASRPKQMSMQAYGSYEVVGARVAIEGADPDQFAIVDDGCSSVLLKPFARCSYGVVFRPTTPGAKQAVVKVRGAGETSQPDLTVAGRGLPTMATTMRTLARRGGHHISGRKLARLLSKGRFSLGVHNWPAAGVVRASLTLTGGPGGSTRVLAASRPTRVTGTGGQPVFVQPRGRALRALRAVGARPKVILRFQLTEDGGPTTAGTRRVRVSAPPAPR